MRALCLALGLLLAAPALGGEPVDLKAGDPAPFAGVLTDSDAWKVAAARRMELEQQIAELKARPCAASGVTVGLVAAAGLFVVGAIIGFVVAK